MAMPVLLDEVAINKIVTPSWTYSIINYFIYLNREKGPYKDMSSISTFSIEYNLIVNICQQRGVFKM